MNIVCCKCGIEKDSSCFNWRNKKLNHRHTICKLCKRIVDNELYIKSSKRRTSIRSRAKKDFHFLNLYVRRIKKLGKCKKCFDRRWYVLDFHHINDDKEAGIPTLIRQGSIEKLKTELRKCILLCSNCHREHHFLERKNNE